MKGRRILYLTAWIAALVFLLLYRQWLAWLALTALLALPVFSLIVSLPAIVAARLTFEAPERLEAGTELSLDIRCQCHLPLPRWKCRVRVERPLTGEVFFLHQGDQFPTELCGKLLCQIERGRICDYLGLFTLPLRSSPAVEMTVRPKPYPMDEQRIQTPRSSCLWKPKADGFAENHELRLYRPGDSIRHIHWKLSAKSGKLVLREPMLPQPGKVLVRLTFRGTPKELDRMMGRFLWLGTYLLEQNISFSVRCLSGAGVEAFPVASEEELLRVLDTLLGKTMADVNVSFPSENADWQYDVGGGTDDA